MPIPPFQPSPSDKQGISPSTSSADAGQDAAFASGLSKNLQSLEESKAEFAADSPQERDELTRSYEQLLKMLVASHDEVARLYEESRRQSALLRATFQSIADAIIIYDNAGIPIASNPAAEQLVGHPIKHGASSQERVKVDPIYSVDGQLIAWEDRPSQRARREVFVNCQMRLARSEGSSRLSDLVLSYSGGPVVDDQGQAQGAVIVFRDITALKESEELLIEQQAEVMALKKVNEAKNHLISVASHELRTPLTGIMGFAELLSLRQLAPEVVQQYAQSILLSAERMTELVNEMLNLQRLETAEIDFPFKIEKS